MIEARELTRRYGPFTAVDHVSFTVEPGSVVGLLGANGAGKTTIMKILTGYHHPHGGSARVDGHDVVDDSLAARRCVGYLPETAPTYGELTTLEYLEFVARARGLGPRSPAIARVLELCSLAGVERRPIGELSKGYRQRVGLAQALIHEPSVVILDEPTSGLDPHQIQEIRRLVREIGTSRTVLLSTHILSEVEAICDRVLILDAGRIVASGTPAEIARSLRSGQVVAVEVVPHPDAAARHALHALGDVISEDAHEHAIELRVALQEGVTSDALFDWAVSSGLRLRALIPEHYSLEEIFTRLTGGSEP